MNIVEDIFRTADRKAVALICDGEEITYDQLIKRVEAAAVPIAATKAARVALDCPNGIAHVVLALAIVRTGKCLVPLASELAAPERERIVRETGVGAILDADGEGLLNGLGAPGGNAEAEDQPGGDQEADDRDGRG